MKVLFDYQVFTEQNYGGTSRYVSFLNKYLPKLGVKSDIGVIFSNNDYLKEDKIGHTFFPSTWFPKKLKIMQLVNKAYTLMQARPSKYDLLHVTYFDGYYINKTKLPVVITIYDMIHEKLYDKYEKLRDDAFIERKRQTLLNADLIIAISETTRQDVLQLYPSISPDKIKTVHLCLLFDKEKEQHLRPTSRLRPYYLYVGSRIMYKNFKLLVDALATLGIPDFDIVCAGGGGFTVEETDYMRSKGVEKFFIQQPVANDETLNQLYQHAVAFVSTSAYEGFGLPTLEAYDNNCPTILADNPCYREIADTAADYFPPDDASILADKLITVFTNNEHREQLIMLAKKRLSFFNKNKLATETLACYESVLKSIK